MLRRIMVRAHELARGMEGDYQARLALALRIAWKEERGKKEEKEMAKIEKRLYDSVIVRLGQHESKTLEFGNYAVRKGIIEIAEETEKAIYIRFVGKLAEVDIETGQIIEEYENEYANRGAWLPKSQIIIGENYIEVPKWLARKYEIFGFAAEK